MRIKRLALFTLIALTFAFSAKIYFDTNHFKMNNVVFDSDKIQEDSTFKILQISDLHNRVFGDNNEELISAVEKSNADIIVITGDFIDRNTDEFKNVFTLIENINAINQHVFFVTGNHEWGNAHINKLLKGLRERNVTILNNKNTQITKKKVTLNLVGIDDSSTNHENLKSAFKNINNERYTILLSHSPGVTEKYNTIPADLILSGHTHGGQVRIPFIGALVAPDQGFFPKLDKGTYKLDPDQYLYIDSGLGTSIVPIRFLNRSQLTLITITNND